MSLFTAAGSKNKGRVRPTARQGLMMESKNVNRHVLFPTREIGPLKMSIAFIKDATNEIEGHVNHL